MSTQKTEQTHRKATDSRGKGKAVPKRKHCPLQSLARCAEHTLLRMEWTSAWDRTFEIIQAGQPVGQKKWGSVESNLEIHMWELAHRRH